ncbi:MAG: ComF family protein [Methylotenera sp.]|nr:ComF family protein [Methylotenera sp.]MSP99448.1 ComF family protein [Methylotenera sp.]
MFFNGLFKQHCLLCATHNGGELGTRHDCLNDLPWHTAPQCRQCGLLTNGSICGSCLSTPPYYEATYSLFTYGFPINTLVQCYKYVSTLNLGRIFGQLLVTKASLETIDLVIPMPMHPTRLKERGFNQALEIVKVLSKDYAEKLGYASVTRQKLTPPLASLSLKDRIKSIKGVFMVTTNLLPQIKNKRIAIVDDVMTTGASLNELAKTLKQADAIHVECWVVARTLPKP